MIKKKVKNRDTINTPKPKDSTTYFRLDFVNITSSGFR